jgi:IS5 family transposase
VNPRDPDASFTVKNGETHFGYKAHLAVDEESGVVRQPEMTSADLHDSQRGEAMIQGDEKAHYADKADDSRALRDKLTNSGSRIASPTRLGATSRWSTSRFGSTRPRRRSVSASSEPTRRSRTGAEWRASITAAWRTTTAISSSSRWRCT